MNISGQTDVCHVMICDVQTDEERLLNYLQSARRSTELRPVRNYTDAVTVYLGLALIDIVDFKESPYGYGDIIVNVWERYVS